MFVFLFIFLRDLPKETVGRVRAVLIEVFIQMTIKKMVIKKMVIKKMMIKKMVIKKMTTKMTIKMISMYIN